MRSSRAQFPKEYSTVFDLEHDFLAVFFIYNMISWLYREKGSNALTQTLQRRMNVRACVLYSLSAPAKTLQCRVANRATTTRFFVPIPQRPLRCEIKLRFRKTLETIIRQAATLFS